MAMTRPQIMPNTARSTAAWKLKEAAFIIFSILIQYCISTTGYTVNVASTSNPCETVKPSPFRFRFQLAFVHFFHAKRHFDGMLGFGTACDRLEEFPEFVAFFMDRGDHLAHGDAHVHEHGLRQLQACLDCLGDGIAHAKTIERRCMIRVAGSRDNGQIGVSGA